MAEITPAAGGDAAAAVGREATTGENADALMRSLRSSIRIQEPREGGRDGAQEPGSVQCSMCPRARRSNWC